MKTKFLQIWSNPRETVLYFQQSLALQFRLYACLTLIYLIQTSAFFLFLKNFTSIPLFRLNGLELVFWYFLTVSLTTLIIILCAALAIWPCARLFKGQGTLLQTCTSVMCVLISLIPIGFLLLLVQFLFLVNFGVLSQIVRMFCYFGFLATMIYGFIVFLETISEIHRFGLKRAFFSIVLGLAILAAIFLMWYWKGIN